MALINSSILKELQDYKEDSFTKNLLVPLYYSLGFFKVDYHGGPYESGKDLICWRKDEIGQIELAVAQVKRYKPSAKASDTKSFMEVVNQLQTASETPVPFTDGQIYLPTIVYFVTPYQVETRALQTRFNTYQSLRAKNIKIIDGPLLLLLLKEHLPNLANEIFGTKLFEYDASTKELNNNTLLRALDFKTDKNISNFYSELQISFGNMSSKFFFELAHSTKNYNLQLTELKWEEFKNTDDFLRKNYQISILKKSSEQITKEYSEKKKFLKPSEQTTEEENSLDRKNKDKEVTVDFELNINQLISFFLDNRDWLKEQIVELNNTEISIKRCRRILLECHKLFKKADCLIQEKNISKILSMVQKDTDNISIEKMPPINISINKIFETGINFGVFGEAGAGKTTCLQMQAKRFSPDTGRQYLVLFIPLALMISRFMGSQVTDKKKEPLELLKEAIVEYYRKGNIDISTKSIDEILSATDSLLLFDGIDEVINSSPWIIEAIYLSSKRYPKAQIVCSARTGGQYLSDIPFLGIKLLPFTDKQQKKFFKKWFENPEDARIDTILNHLKRHKEMSEIVRSPLLATILCVLAEHGVQLPDSEIRLYQERVHLLLGYYDFHKKSQRIESTQNSLNLIARKLALHLHEAEKREMDLDEIISISIKTLKTEKTKEVAIQTVNELIHPCNILESMSAQNSYGFGHFRYQEFFVATEINQNRGFDVINYITRDWWRGALVLFAQLTDSIEFIVNETIKRRITTEAKATLDAMLNIGPPETKMKFKEKINKAIDDENYLRSSSSNR